MITVWDWLILATTLVALYGVILRREARGLVPAQRTLLDYRSVPFSVLLFKAIWRVVTLVCCVVVAFLPIYLSLVILLFVGDPPVAVWVALCLLGPPLGLAAARYVALSALDIAGRVVSLAPVRMQGFAGRLWSLYAACWRQLVTFSCTSLRRPRDPPLTTWNSLRLFFTFVVVLTLVIMFVILIGLVFALPAAYGQLLSADEVVAAGFEPLLALRGWGCAAARVGRRVGVEVFR